MDRNRFLNNVKSCIEEHKMMDGADLVVVGVSGGADSVSLLYSLHALEYNVVACHLNHGIRKDGTAERDAEFVRDLCSKLGVKYYYKYVDIPAISKQLHQTEEEAGRNARYEFFHEVAQSLIGRGIYKIATGANLNDCVETMLMRMARGTTVSGLASIPYVNKEIVRPLLDTPRSEIEAFLKEVGLTYVTDGTNLETEFTRNKVRLELIPYIEKNLNPNFLRTAANNLDSYREDAEYIYQEMDRVYKRIVDGNKINKEKLKELHPSISKRVVLKAIKKFIGSESISFNGAILDSIINGLDATGNTFMVCKGCNVIIGYDSVKLVNPDEKVEHEQLYIAGKLLYDSEYSVNGKRVLKITEVHTDKEIENTGMVCYLPKGLFEGCTFEVHNPREGDKFCIRLFGMTQKLNKMLSTKKIDVDERADLKVLSIDGMVYSVCDVKSTMFDCRVGEFYKVEWL